MPCLVAVCPFFFIFFFTYMAIPLLQFLLYLLNFGLHLQSKNLFSTSVPSSLSLITFPNFNIHFPGFAFFYVCKGSGFVLNCL